MLKEINQLKISDMKKLILIAIVLTIFGCQKPEDMTYKVNYIVIWHSDFSVNYIGEDHAQHIDTFLHGVSFVKSMNLRYNDLKDHKIEVRNIHANDKPYNGNDFIIHISGASNKHNGEIIMDKTLSGNDTTAVTFDTTQLLK